MEQLWQVPEKLCHTTNLALLGKRGQMAVLEWGPEEEAHRQTDRDEWERDTREREKAEDLEQGSGEGELGGWGPGTHLAAGGDVGCCWVPCPESRPVGLPDY